MNGEAARDKLRRLVRPRVPIAPSASASSWTVSLDAAPETVPDGVPARDERIDSAAPEDRVLHSSLAEIVTAPSAREDLVARLSRHAMIRAHARAEVEPSEKAGDVSIAPPSPPERELSSGAPRGLARSERGALARVAEFEGSHAHGARTLDAYSSIDRALLASVARDERLAEIDLSRAVFLDTETTGLSGGAGTYVFLVGLGRFVESRFELWQGFLPHPADERTLLQETSARIADASLIISFFGKSFDRHRLEDKMRLHGVAPPFDGLIHLDLYYPLRRAHRGRFENCRLKTLERELAGVARHDDLPGSFAPAAWFDFLARRPHRLEGVFRHNADDVLSLVTLTALVGRTAEPNDRAR